MDYRIDLEHKAFLATRIELSDLLIGHASYVEGVQAILEGIQRDFMTQARTKKDLDRWTNRKEVLAEFFDGKGPYAYLQSETDYLAKVANLRPTYLSGEFASNAAKRTALAQPNGTAPILDEKVPSSGAISAAAAAALVLKQKEAKLAAYAEELDFLATVKDRAKPLENAVKALSRINGVKVSFGPCYVGTYFKAHLFVKPGLVKDHCYDITMGTADEGYAIYKRKHAPDHDADPPHQCKACEVYEGSGKTLENVLQSIAMIVGIHYPDKATEIDRVIREAINSPLAPERQGSRQSFKKLVSSLGFGG
jgi:hypothetical protein